MPCYHTTLTAFFAAAVVVVVLGVKTTAKKEKRITKLFFIISMTFQPVPNEFFECEKLFLKWIFSQPEKKT